MEQRLFTHPYPVNSLQRMYVIGPVFSHNVSRQDIEAGFRHYAGEEITLAWKHRLINAYEEVPLVQHILFTRYLLMPAPNSDS